LRKVVTASNPFSVFGIALPRFLQSSLRLNPGEPILAYSHQKVSDQSLVTLDGGDPLGILEATLGCRAVGAETQIRSAHSERD
jgi:hypothetical protein